MEEKVSGVSIVLYKSSKVVSQPKTNFCYLYLKKGGRKRRLEKKTLTL